MEKKNTENLRKGELPSDHPDLGVQVFKLKLKTILEDVAAKNIFGRNIIHVCSIQFQKCGLHHAHISVVLEAEDKF